VENKISVLLVLAILGTGCASSLGTPPEAPSRTPNTPRSTVVLSHVDIPAEVPIYPSAIEQEPFDPITDLYSVDNAEIHAVADFYKDEMKALGWDLLGYQNDKAATIGRFRSFLFDNGEVILKITVFAKDGETLVGMAAYTQ